MPSNSEIEAAIAVDPYDLAGYLVYADWLEGEGDPRAELIRLMCHDFNNVAKAIRKLMATHQTHLFGPLAQYRENRGFEMLTWKLGFIHKANFHHTNCDVHDAVAKLLDHASGRLLVELLLTHRDLPPALATLRARAPRSLRMLALTNPGRVVADIGELWSAVPHLTRLFVRGPFELGTLALPEVKHAEIAIEHTATNAASIARAPWSKLEELQLWLDEHATLAEYEPVFSLPALVKLDVAYVTFLDDLCRLLPERAKQLRSLRFRGDALTDDGAMELADRIDLFDDLQEIDITDTKLSRKAIAALKECGPEILGGWRYDDADE